MKTKRQGKRAVGYVRVSDESQIDGHSLDAQRAEIARWCELRGYELVEFYADEGKTAKSDRIAKRPALSRLLSAGDADGFDIAVVHTLDRWARNSLVQAQSLQRLGQNGIGFVSVMEQIDYTTPAGKMILTTLGAAHEFFSDQLGVHVAKSHRHKATQGLIVGPLPFGYRRSEGGVAVVEPDEAEAIVGAFQQRLAGDSNGAIARRLDIAGFRTRTGRRFTAHAVKDLLNCRTLTGVVLSNGEEYKGKHQAIVTRDLFDSVQQLRRRRCPRTPGGARGVVQGRIACIRCGSNLNSDRQHRHGKPMYRERHGVECETNNRAILAEAVDAQIGRLFASLSIPNDWRERIGARAAKHGSRRVDVAALDEEKRRNGRAFADGALPEDEYNARLADIEVRRRLAHPAAAVRLEECTELLGDLHELWDEATLEERARLIAPLIEHVWIDVASREICAITPTDGFATIIGEVLEQPDWSACFLLPAEAANQPEWWTWWRRGRIELPVQVGNALSLLQAYFRRLVSLRRALRSARTGPAEHLRRAASASRAQHPS